MANTVRIKRRVSGNIGAPSALKNAELAMNEVDGVIYYGKGDDGNGNATSVIAVAGSGAYVDKSSDQSIGGTKTFTSDIAGSITGNSATATKLATSRTISVSSDVTGSASFDGTANASITATLASSGVVAGTYTKLTVDAKGRATTGATASISDLSVPTADVSWDSKKLTNLADPTAAQDGATKAYVDSIAQGLDPKGSVKAASTANIATLSGAMTIDGIALVTGDRILVKDQTAKSANGIYVIASGAWTRATDSNTWDKLISAYVFVEEGTTNADNGYLCTIDQGGTLGTTDVTFVQFSGAGQITAGAGLTKTGNQIDVGTASSSRIVVNADNVDLATTGVGASTYKSVTVDVYGRVTAGTNPTTLAGYGITDAQAKDNTLTALAGVTTVADKMIYATASDTFTTCTITSYGRSLIDDADAGSARGTLGLGTLATQAANNVAITGGSIDNITIDGGTF